MAKIHIKQMHEIIWYSLIHYDSKISTLWIIKNNNPQHLIKPNDFNVYTHTVAFCNVHINNIDSFTHPKHCTPVWWTVKVESWSSILSTFNCVQPLYYPNICILKWQSTCIFVYVIGFCLIYVSGILNNYISFFYFRSL